MNNTILMHIDAFLLIFGQLFILKSSRIASLCLPPFPCSIVIIWKALHWLRQLCKVWALHSQHLAKKWTRVVDFEMSIGSNQLHFSIILTCVTFDMVRLSTKGGGDSIQATSGAASFWGETTCSGFDSQELWAIRQLAKNSLHSGSIPSPNSKLWKSWGLDLNQIRGCKAMMKTHKKCGVGNVPFGLFYLGALLRVFGTSLKVQWMINPEEKGVKHGPAMQGPGHDHGGSSCRIDRWSAWVVPLSWADPLWRPITDPHGKAQPALHGFSDACNRGGQQGWQQGFSGIPSCPGHQGHRWTEDRRFPAYGGLKPACIHHHPLPGPLGHMELSHVHS